MDQRGQPKNIKGDIQSERGERDQTRKIMFGDFTFICQKAQLPFCGLLGDMGIEAVCYARNVEVANTLIFQAATCFAHLGALIMTLIMVFHVRSKYTAVGRKEILHFFYLYMSLTIISLILDSGVIPFSSSVYPYFVAVQQGFAFATVWCLFVNGFVGFQLVEDGTTLIIWLLRLSCLVAFVVAGGIALCTFKSWIGLSPNKTVGFFVVQYIGTAVLLFIYVVLQLVLVLRTLQDRWPLGDIGFGALFFITGQVVLYVFSTKVCENVKHYLDGLFFATICNLLAVMMVYKYWDSITKEDLEFSVLSQNSNWFVPDKKDSMAFDGGRPYESDCNNISQLSVSNPTYTRRGLYAK